MAVKIKFPGQTADELPDPYLYKLRASYQTMARIQLCSFEIVIHADKLSHIIIWEL